MDKSRLHALTASLRQAVTSFNVLFAEPRDGGMVARDTGQEDVVLTCQRLLSTMVSEAEGLETQPDEARRYYEALDSTPDSLDYLNQLVRLAEGRPLAKLVRRFVWNAVRERMQCEANEDAPAEDARYAYYLSHVKRLLTLAVSLPRDYMELLRAEAAEEEGAIPRLEPVEYGSLEADAEAIKFGDGAVPESTLEHVRACVQAQDVFAGGRAFRPVGHGFVETGLGEIRALQDFYGYHAERRLFVKYLQSFIDGQTVQPLLLSGLPGLGKTHLTIAFARSYPELTLIVAGESDLQERFEWLINELGRYTYRRLVLFFDDVDVDEIDWSTFRHLVDGYLPYASNVAVIIASNFTFPDRVQSRCRTYEFRPMSPEVCVELVLDHLDKHMGINPQDNQLATALAETIAGHYVNELRLGRITELTPRSLVRFFRELDHNPKRVRALLTEAGSPMHIVPDETYFRAHNERLQELVDQERMLHTSSDETVTPGK